MIDKTKLKTILTEIISDCVMVHQDDYGNCPDFDIEDEKLNDWVDKFEELIK